MDQEEHKETGSNSSDSSKIFDKRSFDYINTVTFDESILKTKYIFGRLQPT
jgi:hypothetical protein